MEHSEFLAWNHPGCFPFGVIWGQACPMVCGRLPWNNVLNFWLETFRVVSHLVLFEARHVPWFAGGYHGTFWIYVFYVNIEPHSWHKTTSFLIVLSTCTGKSLSEALTFEVVWGQVRPMVCGRLPWNVLDFWLEIFWVVSHLVLFEARRVPWFAGGYHGTFWIYVFT